MWKTLLLRMLFFLIGFFACWAVLTCTLPIYLTISPTVGIVLLETPLQQLVGKSVLSAICGVLFACIPSLFGKSVI